MNEGVPFIIRLNSRHGVRGPVHNPTFSFDRPFRVPEGHVATLSLFKLFFRSPRKVSPTELKINVSATRTNGTTENLTFNLFDEIFGFLPEATDDVDDLANMYQMYAATLIKISRYFFGTENGFSLRSANSSDPARTAFQPIAANEGFVNFRECMMATNGRGFLRMWWEGNAEVDDEGVRTVEGTKGSNIVSLTLSGSFVRYFGLSSDSGIVLYNDITKETAVQCTPFVSYIRVACDKVRNTYMNSLSSGGMVLPDGTLALIPNTPSPTVSNSMVFYTNESGANRCMMNGEYLESITFAFYDGLTGDRLLSMNDFIVELELRVVALLDQPTYITMEDTRKLMQM